MQRSRKYGDSNENKFVAALFVLPHELPVTRLQVPSREAPIENKWGGPEPLVQAAPMNGVDLIANPCRYRLTPKAG